MKVYIVSVDGEIWGAFSAMDKAVLQVCEWISRAHETYVSFDRPSNGSCTIKTDKSSWTCEELAIDEV